jgi:hypothetical protein
MKGEHYPLKSHRLISFAGVLAAAMLLGLITSPARADYASASVNGWEGGSGGWWSSTLYDQQQSEGDYVSASSTNWPAHAYEYSGFAEAEARPGIGGGVRAWALDPLSSYDANGVYSLGEAHQTTSFVVTSPGTIGFSTLLSAALEVGVADGWVHEAEVHAGIMLRYFASGQYHTLSQWGGAAELVYSNNSGLYWSNRNGLNEGEATLDANGHGTVHAQRDFLVSLPIEATYDLTLTLWGSAFSNSWAGADSHVECDAMSSMGFLGGNFWDVVEGTAAFYDPDDPTNQHIPEPTTLAVLLAGSSVLLRRTRA